MPITITMPALSPTMEEGAINSWFVKEGDTVASGDLLAEIETDKAAMELEAVEEGVIAKLLVTAGTEGIPVNAPIAILLEEGEDASSLDGFVPTAGLSPVSVPAEEGAAPPPEVAPPPAPAEAEASVMTAPAAPSGNGRIFSSPLARRIAAAKNLDLSTVVGSGPRGRIVKADVEAAVAAPRPAAVAQSEAQVAPLATPAAPTATAGPQSAPGEAPYTEIPLDGMRKTIARRLTESKQTVPHFYLTIDCEIDELLATRKRLNEKLADRPDGGKISVNDFVIRAAALALRQVPEANASWTDTAIRRYTQSDISVAVAVEGGLITPIIRSADTKGLQAIGTEMADLAARARDRKLKPEEYQGGTFSISNLGMFGIREFSAVINPPQGAILAVGAGEQRPVVKDGALAVATVMSCTLSCDHRVVDGATGSLFLAAFKNYIDDPLNMLL
jgi:pyruvate dehydrogenase E2 component (dihydrolipoamide acetyltransferase)